MKNINIHNYEEYALEFINGELDEKGMDAFSEFLGEHPDLADDILLFDLDQDIKEKPTPIFDGLKRNLGELNINKHNFEEYCIASLEGDLDQAAELKLQQYIDKDNILQKEYNLLAKCKLSDEIMVLPNKEALKAKKAIIPRRTIGIASSIVAASIIAFMLLLTPSTNTTESEIAMVQTLKKNHSIPQKITKESPELEDIKTEKPEVKENKNTTPQKESNKNNEKTIKKHSPKVTIQKQTTTPLATIQSKRTTIPSYPITIKGLNLIEQTQEQAPRIAQADTNKNLREKAKDYLYTTVFSKGIDGINKMAETELDYEVVEDENGEPVKMIIKSRFGEINRTLAQR